MSEPPSNIREVDCCGSCEHIEINLPTKEGVYIIKNIGYEEVHVNGNICDDFKREDE